jgi:GNAT superfamily N-acetyltransferase
VCETILRALPDWFGNEASIADYTRGVADMDLFAAYDGGKVIGFTGLKTHNPYTAEIAVMGVLTQYHRHGIGARMVEACVALCRARAMEFLTVKTLDASHPDEGYGKTRRFYEAMGFRPLEVFPLLWDAENPCLFMAQYL